MLFLGAILQIFWQFKVCYCCWLMHITAIAPIMPQTCINYADEPLVITSSSLFPTNVTRLWVVEVLAQMPELNNDNDLYWVNFDFLSTPEWTMSVLNCLSTVKPVNKDHHRSRSDQKLTYLTQTNIPLNNRHLNIQWTLVVFVHRFHCKSKWMKN